MALSAAVVFCACTAAQAATGSSSMVCKRSGCVAVYRPATQAAHVSSASPTAAPPGSPLILAGFTWSGATPNGPSASNWSNGTNWMGGIAPGGSVGTLTFPILTIAACTTNPPTDACYSGFNNITGLNASALSIDDGAAYFMQGNLLKLGAGGITASTASTAFGSPPTFTLPIALTAAQTWTIDGNNNDSQLGLGGSITGSTHALTIDLNNQTFLGVNSGNVEVGPITINTTSASSFNGSVALAKGGKLNATDGQSVSLMGTGTGIFAAFNASVGALSASGGSIQIGNGSSSAAKLSVSGGFTQGASNTLTLNVIKPGTTAGTDYSQLSATGAISLAGALRLAGSTSSGTACPTLHVGDVDTILTTPGALTGTFTGIPDGATVLLSCGGGVQPTGRINYTANSVTFTVLTAGGVPTVTNVKPNAGPTAGTNTVVIRGTNFVNGSTVKFGTVASPSVTFVSATELKAVAPAEASGVVDVRVTTAGAVSATSSHDLYAYGAPTVTSFTPGSGLVGTSVTITGTNFVPKATVKFNGTASTSVTFVSATQIKATVPTGATTGPISVTTPAGTGTSSTSFTVT